MAGPRTGARRRRALRQGRRWRSRLRPAKGEFSLLAEEGTGLRFLTAQGFFEGLNTGGEESAFFAHGLVEAHLHALALAHKDACIVPEVQAGLRRLPCGRHGKVQCLGEAGHGIGEASATQRFSKLAEVEAHIAVVGRGIEFQRAHVPGALQDDTHRIVIHSGEELHFRRGAVRGNGVGETGCSLHIQLGRLSHHPAKEGDVEAIHRRVEVSLVDLPEIGREPLALFADGGFRIKIMGESGFGNGCSFAFGKKEQCVIDENAGNGFSKGAGPGFFRTPLHAGFGQDVSDLLGAQGRFHAKFVELQAHLPLPALGADTRAGHAAHHGALG